MIIKWKKMRYKMNTHFGWCNWFVKCHNNAMYEHFSFIVWTFLNTNPEVHIPTTTNQKTISYTLHHLYPCIWAWEVFSKVSCYKSTRKYRVYAENRTTWNRQLMIKQTSGRQAHCWCCQKTPPKSPFNLMLFMLQWLNSSF